MTTITEAVRLDKQVDSVRVSNPYIPTEWARNTRWYYELQKSTNIYLFDTRGEKFNGGWTIACLNADHAPLLNVRTKSEGKALLESLGQKHCDECSRNSARKVLNEIIERNDDWLKNADYVDNLNDGGYFTSGEGRRAGGVNVTFGYGVVHTGESGYTNYEGVSPARAKAEVVVVDGQHTIEYKKEWSDDDSRFATLEELRDHCREMLVSQIEERRAQMAECNYVCREALNLMGA